MTLWKEVIRIPEAVERDRFVVELSRVDDPEQAKRLVDSYVVTASLEDSFRRALGAIEHALDTDDRSALFLHGSFGSGKSHFMAILYLILRGDHNARSIQGITESVDQYTAKHENKKIMLVPFHFMDARTVEQMTFKTYIEHVAKHYPDKPRPALLATDRLLSSSDELRSELGDEKFFANLNEADPMSGEDVDDFGGMVSGATWNAGTYEAARHASAGTTERSSLLRAVSNMSFFQTMFDMGSKAAGTDGVTAWDNELFVNFDDGLHEMAVHAKSLGFDGLVLFLDELILWLMSRTERPGFVQGEINKIVKLVESKSRTADEIPIISFVARQRQFRDFIGDVETGSQAQSIGDAIDHMQGRFGEIELPSKDIADIAHARLLKPIDDAAKKKIDESFKQTLTELHNAAADTVDTLVSGRGDPEYFRRVFPFSPALAEVLIALSDLLQRNRSALRVMTELLTDNRETLKLGDIVSVGRLWDKLSGEHPMNAEIARRFRQAEDLWTQRFEPMIRSRSGLPKTGRIEDATQGSRQDYEQDSLIIKTLLLQTLVPRFATFDKLRLRRLVALNRSDVYADFVGTEDTHVLERLRRIGNNASELHIEEGPNPIIRISLSNVNVDDLLAEHTRQDSAGNRQIEFRRLFLESAGFASEPNALNQYRFEWNGASRPVDISFINVRKSTVQDYMSGDTLRLIVDYPFDEDPGKRPSDDVRRLQAIMKEEAMKRRRSDAFSVVWLPHHFNDEVRGDLGRLAVIRYILNNKSSALQNVSESLRGEAEVELEALRKRIESSLEQAMLAAYHLGGRMTSDIGERLGDAENFFNVTFLEERPFPKPNATSFDGAVKQIFREGFRLRYPEAPSSPPLPAAPLKGKNLERFAESVVDAFEAKSESYQLSHLDRKTRDAVVEYGPALELFRVGSSDSNRLQTRDDWKRTFDGAVDSRKNDEIQVGWLRDFIDSAERPTGIPRALQDVIIMAWAAQTGRGFHDLGSDVAPEAGKLSDTWHVVEANLPSATSWARFEAMAGSLLGRAEKFRRAPRGVGRAATLLKEKFGPHSSALTDLRDVLTARANRCGVSGDVWASSDRFQQVEAARKVAAAAVAPGRKDTELIEQLIEIDGQYPGVAWERVVEQAKKAAEHRRYLATAQLLDIDDLAQSFPDDPLMTDIRNVFERSEKVVPLEQLTNLNQSARERLKELRRATHPPAAVPSPVQPETPGAETPEHAPGVTPEAASPLHAGDQPAERINLRRANVDDVVARVKELVEDDAEYVVEIWRK